MGISVLKQEKEFDFNNNAAHILQTTYWGNFLKSIGRKVEYLVDGSTGYLLTFNKVPFTSLKIVYIQKSVKPTKALIKYIKQNYKDILYIKFEPQVEDSPENRRYLNSINLKRSSWNIFVPSTMFIDLKPSKEELYRHLDTNTQRNIKKAEKINLSIEERADEDAIKIFLELNHETTKRQVYFSHSDDYYINMWKMLTASNKAIMLLAKHEAKYIGAIILFIHKDTLYYPYGASKQTNTGAMAYLHYNAMLRAKGEIGSILNNKNLNTYDLWGTLSKKDELNPYFKNMPLAGIHRFKKGLGGNIVTYVGSYDYVMKPITYHVFNILSLLRKKYYGIIKSIKKNHG